MKKKMNGKKSHKVSEATRDAVVRVAEGAHLLKQKTAKLAHIAGRKWEESKPRQQQAKEELRKAADKLVDFGKELQTGFNEGVAEVQKRSKKRI